VHLAFTDEQEELRAAIRSVLAKECPPSLPRAISERRADAGDLWATMCALDWPALTIPEADGGIGYGYVELAVLVEELGRAIAPGPLFPTITQYLPFVRELGSVEQRRALLGAVAGGRSGTVAVAEAPTGWALDGIRATLRPDGDDWILDGIKHHVLTPDVDEVAVVARQPSGELAVAVVAAGGAVVDEVTPLDLTRPVGHLSFAELPVSGDRVLAEGGTAAVRRALEEATVAMAVETLGTCQAIFEVTLQYAKDRQQFGVPIGSFQAVKHRLADCYIALERARALCYFAVACLAEDDPRRHDASAMAKAAAGDGQRFVAAEGIQLLGGIAYTWEHDQHLWVKRAITGGLLFGQAAEHRADLVFD
jgi:alkylation response protein AidB-like acyl-CoA dehydrogenase